MEINNHGGECCGITHLYCFENDEDVEALEEYINDYRKNPIPPAYPEGFHLFEVVVINYQLYTFPSKIKDVLKKLGFKRVSRFKNNNSGNTCNVYHLIAQRGEDL